MEKKLHKLELGGTRYAFDIDCFLRKFTIILLGKKLRLVSNKQNGLPVYIDINNIFETKEAAYEWALAKLQTEFNDIQNDIS